MIGKDIKDANDLVYAVALRAKGLADEYMSNLRRIAEADVTCNTRGKLIEHVLLEEFIEEFPKYLSEE